MPEAPAFIGVATPQANPTVEIEFAKFLRGPTHALFTRLTSRAEAFGARLLDYLDQMPSALASFDTLPLRAFAFACTGSSYLAGNEKEETVSNALMQKYRIPVVTATQAIRRELEGHGATRIAMLAPYPAALCEAAIAYWRRLGFDVVAHARIDVGEDTRRIYGLSDVDVASALRSFDPGDADLILLSGTGMPTIAALEASTLPMLSSNLCLATEVLRRARLWPPNEAADVRRLCGTVD